MIVNEHTSIVCEWCMDLIAFCAHCLLAYVTNAQPAKEKTDSLVNNLCRNKQFPGSRWWQIWHTIPFIWRPLRLHNSFSRKSMHIWRRDPNDVCCGNVKHHSIHTSNFISLCLFGSSHCEAALTWQLATFEREFVRNKNGNLTPNDVSLVSAPMDNDDSTRAESLKLVYSHQCPGGASTAARYTETLSFRAYSNQGFLHQEHLLLEL